MALNQITTEVISDGGGAITSPLHVALFVGEAPKKNGELTTIDASVDAVETFGAGTLADQIEGWKTHANGAMAYVLTVADGGNIIDAIKGALERVEPELVVVTKPATGKQDLIDLEASLKQIAAEHAVFSGGIIAAPAIDAGTQTWDQYATALQPITDGVSLEKLAVVPLVYPNALGALAGRLCNASYSIAESTGRVASGGYLLNGDPVDSAGKPYTNTAAKRLADNRFTVPQFYASKEGVFFTDTVVLGGDGNDYQAISTVRLANEITRQLLIVLLDMINNRSVNNSTAGLASAKKRLLKPLLELAKKDSSGVGQIQAPTDQDIHLSFVGPKHLTVAATFGEIGSPSKINLTIAVNND
jgi:hypothetical protein